MTHLDVNKNGTIEFSGKLLLFLFLFAAPPLPSSLFWIATIDETNIVFPFHSFNKNFYIGVLCNVECQQVKETKREKEVRYMIGYKTLLQL
jgi:hypothetical protein